MLINNKASTNEFHYQFFIQSMKKHTFNMSSEIVKNVHYISQKADALNYLVCLIINLKSRDMK